MGGLMLVFITFLLSVVLNGCDTHEITTSNLNETSIISRQMQSSNPSTSAWQDLTDLLLLLTSEHFGMRKVGADYYSLDQDTSSLAIDAVTTSWPFVSAIIDNTGPKWLDMVDALGTCI